MLKPLGEYSILVLSEDEGKTESGIILPDSADLMFAHGLVVSPRPNRTLDGGQSLPPTVQEGDKVLFARYAAVKIEEEGKTFFFVKDADILAKFE